MKIAIPSETDQGLQSFRSGHFGHAAYFTIVEIDDYGQVVSVESVKNVDHGAQGCGGVIQYVIGLGLDGILTAGMGPRPYTTFTQNGITVYSDRSEPIVGNALQLFLEGKVTPMDPGNVCRH